MAIDVNGIDGLNWFCCRSNCNHLNKHRWVHKCKNIHNYGIVLSAVSLDLDDSCWDKPPSLKSEDVLHGRRW